MAESCLVWFRVRCLVILIFWRSSLAHVFVQRGWHQGPTSFRCSEDACRAAFGALRAFYLHPMITTSSAIEFWRFNSIFSHSAIACMHDSVSELKNICEIINRTAALLTSWYHVRASFYLTICPNAVARTAESTFWEQDQQPLSISLRTSNPNGNNTIQARMYTWFSFRTKIRVESTHERSCVRGSIYAVYLIFVKRQPRTRFLYRPANSTLTRLYHAN